MYLVSAQRFKDGGKPIKPVIPVDGGEDHGEEVQGLWGHRA